MHSKLPNAWRGDRSRDAALRKRTLCKGRQDETRAGAISRNHNVA